MALKLKLDAVLVVGAAGFIGSNFCRYLIENYSTRYLVVGIDILWGSHRNNLPKELIFYKMDAVKKIDMKTLFKKYRFKYVVHLASMLSGGMSHFVKSLIYKDNLSSLINVLNYSVRWDIKRIVFASSTEVYGEQSAPFQDDMLPSPTNSYGIAKMAAELELKNTSNDFGIKYCVLRFQHVYGPNQFVWDKYRGVLGKWMVQYNEDRAMTIWGDGEHQVSFLYISDVMEPLHQAMINTKAENEIINVGSEQPYTINQWNELVRDVVGGGRITYDTEWPYITKNAYSNPTKAKEILGLTETVSIFDGVTNLWNFVKDRDIMRPYDFKELNIYNKIPERWSPKNYATLYYMLSPEDRHEMVMKGTRAAALKAKNEKKS